MGGRTGVGTSRGRRTVWSASALALCALTALGCSDSSRGGGVAASAASVQSGTSAVASGASAGATPSSTTGGGLAGAIPVGPLTPALTETVARTFAPQLRFNAYHNDGNGARQNRNEDFFPMGVASFLRELASGQVRVVVHESRDASPSVSEVRPTSDVPVFGATHLGPYPRRMVGDPPGTAPLYVHVYEDPSGRALSPDGSGELVFHVEYWVFYGHDRAEARLLNFISTGSLDVTGHRTDWEHTSFRVRVRVGPGSAYQSGVLEAGTYYAHGGGVHAVGSEIERVSDQGLDDPAGTHPVVYVSQGKHASYPEAGEWRDSSYPAFLAEHTDFFRGNGVWIDGWRVPLLDLERPSSDPAEFTSPEFQQLVLRSPGVPASLPDWTQYMGRWGPDLTLFQTSLATVRIATSPSGPKAKSKYGDMGGNYRRWSDVKQTQGRLKVYKDLGITIPRVVPPPAPIRR